MTASRSWSAVVISTFALMLLPMVAGERHRAQTPPGPYVLTDLGTLGGLSAQAYGINERGDVVGYSATAASQGHAFLWQNGVMTDLGTLGGNSSIAYAIDSAGQVVGYSALAGNSGYHAFLWENGVKTDLTPGLPAGEGSTASAINDLGQVIGTINYWRPFLWQNGALTFLDHLGGGGGFGGDINNLGQAVGSSYTTIVTELGPMQHAALWQNGGVSDLGLLPGDEDSGAGGINDVGQIVGSTGRTDPQTYEAETRGSGSARQTPSRRSDRRC